MADNVPLPPMNALWGGLFFAVTISAIITIFVPRIWKKGWNKTFRWFKRMSSEGPFFRCLCFSCQKTLGRCTVRSTPAPTVTVIRAVSSRAATVVLQHEPAALLSADTFEIELKLSEIHGKAVAEREDEEKDGDGWRSVYTGPRFEFRADQLAPDSTFLARARAHNQAGSSEYSSAMSFETRQTPNADNGGHGPRLQDAALAALLGRPQVSSLYTWAQTDDEVQLRLRVPPGCRGRQLDVQFEPNRLSIAYTAAGADGGARTELLAGTLLRNVKHEECTWDLEEAKYDDKYAEESKQTEEEDGADSQDDGMVLVVTLEKVTKADFGEKKERWSCVVVGHPLIDINL